MLVTCLFRTFLVNDFIFFLFFIRYEAWELFLWLDFKVRQEHRTT